MTTQPLASNRLEFDDPGDAIEHYMAKGWTDGLPIVPPTVDKVGHFLDHASLAPTKILATEPTKGRVITAEKVAVNAVMAGCLPEYFPVVVAAVEAMSQPEFNLHGASVSTMGAAVLTVVNGPIAVEIGLNSGVGVFGPGNRANATIGRAVRLVLINATGAVPGVLDKSTLGHGGKYTWCMAEDEDRSPWAPMHVDRGYAADQSTVSIFAGLSPIYTTGGGREPETALGGFKDALLASGRGHHELVIVLSPETLGHIEAAGWSKRQVKEFLFKTGQDSASGEDVAESPDSITVIVAGGAAGGICAVIPLWGGGSNSQSVTRAI